MALALLLFSAAVLVKDYELRQLAIILALIAVALYGASYLPGLGKEPPFVPRLSRGLLLESHEPVSTSDPRISGYRVTFRIVRPVPMVRLRVTADRPITMAGTTIALIGDHGLERWWGADPVRREGSVAVFAWRTPPTVDERH